MPEQLAAAQLQLDGASEGDVEAVTAELHRLVHVLSDAGQLDAGRALFTSAPARIEALVGPEQAAVGVIAGVLGEYHYLQSEMREAFPHMLRAVAHLEAGGTLPMDNGDVYLRAARLLSMAGQPERALALTTVAEAEAVSEANTPRRLEALVVRSDVLGASGRVEQARNILDEALELMVAEDLAQHPIGLIVRRAHARGITDLDARAEAVDALLQEGPTGELRVLLLGDRAYLARRQGDLQLASHLLDDAWAMTEADAFLAAQQPEIQQSRAEVQYALGNRTAARELTRWAVERSRRQFGPVSLQTSASIRNALGIYRRNRDQVVARLLAESHAADVVEQLPSGHPLRIRALHQVAATRMLLGDGEGAGSAVGQVLAELDEGLLPKGQQVGLLASLGGLLVAAQDAAGAVDVLERTLALTSEGTNGMLHTNLAGALWYLSDAERMLHHARIAVEMEPDQVAACVNMALALADNGEHEAARERMDAQCLDEAIQDTRYFSAVIAELGGERRRALRESLEDLAVARRQLELVTAMAPDDALSVMSTLRRTLDLYLSLESDPFEAYRQVLYWKGLGSRTAERRQQARSLTGRAAELIGELEQLERRIASDALSDGVRDPERDARRRQLEAELAAAGARVDGQGLTPKQLCSYLDKDAVLVDLLRTRVTQRRPYRYTAFVLDGADCSLERVELGDAEPLEEAVQAWRESLASPRVSASRQLLAGAAVHELLWAPLAPHVRGRRRAWVVPDGVLATVPLGALPDASGRLLIEDWELGYLSRAEHLAREAATETDKLLLIGGVEYGEAPARPDGEPVVRGACVPEALVPLPGTLAEVASIAAGWPRATEVTRLTGGAATETAVTEALGAHDVVHIATHGFFTAGCGGATSNVDPFLRSGLALAGANSSEELGDALLMASEVAELDLSRTHLVVLSACETGLGTVQSGEGVLGLRRAFSVAGTDVLVMSLWSVEDQATAQLMKELYRGLRRGWTPQRALRTAQLTMLHRARRKLGHSAPNTWAAFVANGHSR